MDPLLFLVGALALALVFAATLLKSCKGQLTRSNQELNEERGKVAAAHEAVAEHMRIKTEAETRLRGLEEMLQQETAEKALLAADRDAARDRQREAEKDRKSTRLNSSQ